MNAVVFRVWEKAGTIAFYLVMTLASFMTIFPFVWSAILSTRDRQEFYTPGLSLFLGDSLTANYAILMDAAQFWQSMWNSIVITGWGTLFSILFCSMGGFAFAVYKFRGKNVVFSVMLGSMMIPPVLGLIPYFIIIRALGLIDTHIAVWLPFTAIPFGIFLVRQYVVSAISTEMLEAARMDGATEWRIYWNVVLPLMKPVLGTLAIVQFVFFWNNFLTPLIALSTPEKATVQLVLRSLQGVGGNTPWGAVMLGTTISVLPILVFYAFASKQMMAGLTSGAVKG